MDIGTAKPSIEERSSVAHHMFDVAYPNQSYTVAQYKKEATQVMDNIFAAGKIPIVCGGTGFYARALLEGLLIPEVPPQEDLRNQLKKEADEHGNKYLHEKLAQLDPVTAQKLNVNDRFRIIRALEVTLTCGKPFSQLTAKTAMPFNVIWIGLTVHNREQLRQSIKARFAEQLRLGLVGEAESLYKRFGDCRTLLHSVNYTEFLRFFKGELTFEAAQELCLLHNNQLARRQLIWFRANSQMNWFEIDRIDCDQLFSLVHARVSESLPG